MSKSDNSLDQLIANTMESVNVNKNEKSNIPNNDYLSSMREQIFASMKKDETKSSKIESNKRYRSRSRSRSRSREKYRSKYRSRSREKYRSKYRSRSRSRDRNDRDRERRYRHSRDSSGRDSYRYKHSEKRYKRSRSPSRGDYIRKRYNELSREEREKCTIQLENLPPRVIKNDVEDFFSSEIRKRISSIRFKLSPSGKCYGTGYVEFIPKYLNEDGKDIMDAKELENFLNNVLEYSGRKLAGRTVNILYSNSSIGEKKETQSQSKYNYNQRISENSQSSTTLIPQIQGIVTPTSLIELRNMFDPKSQEAQESDFYEELQEDIKDECSKYGKVLNIDINKTNEKGIVRVEFNSIPEAATVLNKMRGRYFGGKTLECDFV